LCYGTRTDNILHIQSVPDKDFSGIHTSHSHYTLPWY